MVTGMRLGAVVIAIALGALGIVVLAGTGDASSDDGPRVLGPGRVTVRLVVHDSKFLPSRIHVRPS